MTRNHEPGAVRIGADVGGTFTDVVVIAPTGITIRKVLSSVDDYSRSVVSGIDLAVTAAGAALEDVTTLVHATTVVTNAILENKGARCGLITTTGFRDVLEIGRLRRPNLYDLAWRRPPPLVPRELRVEVAERIDATGKVIYELDLDSVDSAIEHLVRAGVAAVAVCLINSYANPCHEVVIGERLAALAPMIEVTLSSALLPEVREFERTSTAVVDAYVSPVLRRYVTKLQETVRSHRIAAPLLLMQSNGGAVPADVATRRAAALVESGPAAGALAVAAVARALGRREMIGLDIGGTTAKACLVENGRVRESKEMEVGAGLNVDSRLLRGGGYTVSLPSVDLAEVGAGGGSIASVDRGGGLRVGPESAGSTPGPVCYGRGGERPTLTDAFAALGYIGEEGLAGGAQPVDVGAARYAIAREIAAPLGLTPDRAAWGIFTVGVATMLSAVRAVTTQRGRDPRALDIVAFGGAGPLHAAEVAAQLGVKRVFVPPLPGVFSSFGLLLSDLRFDFQSPVMRLLSELPSGLPLASFSDLERRGRIQLDELGIGWAAANEEWRADMHYEGQNSDLLVTIDRDMSSAEVADAFHAEHLATYGHRSDAPVMVATVRLAVSVPERGRGYRELVELVVPPPAVTRASRTAYFGDRWGRIKTPVIDRCDLGEASQRGPLIVTEYDSTTVVPPGFTAHLDQLHNIVLEGIGR